MFQNTTISDVTASRGAEVPVFERGTPSIAGTRCIRGCAVRLSRAENACNIDGQVRKAQTVKGLKLYKNEG